MSEVIPYLYIKGAAKAIDFYTRAFGARETYARITDGDGRVGHAELTIGASTIFLADEHPEIGVISPATLGGSHMSFVINLPNVDDVVKQAVAVRDACVGLAGAERTRVEADRLGGALDVEVRDHLGRHGMSFPAAVRLRSA